MSGQCKTTQWSFVVMAFFPDPILAEGLPMWRETMPCSSLHLLDRVRLHKFFGQFSDATVLSEEAIELMLPKMDSIFCYTG